MSAHFGSLPPVGPTRGSFQAAPMGMQGGYGGGMQGGNMQGGGMGYGGGGPTQQQGNSGPQLQYTNPQFVPQPIQTPTFSPSMSPTAQSPNSSSMQGGVGGMTMQRPNSAMQQQGNTQQHIPNSSSNQGLATLSTQPSINGMMNQGMQFNPQQQQQPQYSGIGSNTMQPSYGQPMQGLGGGPGQFNNNPGMMGQPNSFGGYNNMGGGSMGGPQMGGMVNNAGMMKGSMTRSQVPEQWRTGIAGFFDDCFTCGVGTCLTGCLYGENYQKIYGYGFMCPCAMYTMAPCFACCFANQTRAELRKKYNLVEEPCGDCCIHFFCSPCAVCQEARELRIRERWITMP